MTQHQTIDQTAAEPAELSEADRLRAREQAEKDVFLSFGAFPLRNLITRVGLLALIGAAGYGVYLAFLNA